MLHALRQRRQTLGRGMVYMLVAVWMSLALQPCVAAAMATDDCAACPSMTVEQGMEQPAAASAACAQNVSCASAYHPDAAQTATAEFVVPPQPLLGVIHWQILQPSPGDLYYVSSAPLAQSAPPPLARFCVLQV